MSPYAATDGGECRSDLDPRSQDWARREALRQDNEIEHWRTKNVVLDEILLDAACWAVDRNGLMNRAIERIRKGQPKGA